MELAVQRGFDQPAAVYPEHPLLAAVPSEGEEQVEAGRRNLPVRVVDPVVENVQEAVRVIKVRVCEPSDRGNSVVPLGLSVYRCVAAGALADPERLFYGCSYMLHLSGR